MTNGNRFKQAMAALAAVYQNAMQAEQIAIYWDALGRFNPDHLDKAVKAHIADTKEGKWFPKPAHLIGHINELMAAEKDAEQLRTIMLSDWSGQKDSQRQKSRKLGLRH